MKLSELTYTQRCHLAWRLDAKGFCGFCTACSIARGEKGDLEIVDIFKFCGATEHSAKIHTRKVINFRLKNGQPLRASRPTQ